MVNMNQAENVVVAIKRTVEKEKVNYLYEGIKRIFDIIVALIACLFLIPMIIGIKIASLLSNDKQSIFFTQERIGKNGKTFKLYKFRSMIPNADQVLFELLESNKELAKEYQLNKKLKEDPRITKVGKFIRKYSIDEFPQVINILKGDMSFIGNRPYLPREREDIGIFYEDIVKTKPGLTGYWQVSGRSNTTFQRRLELERYYSKNHSLLLDIQIFVKTFGVVLFGKDAK